MVIVNFQTALHNCTLKHVILWGHVEKHEVTLKHYTYLYSQLVRITDRHG